SLEPQITLQNVFKNKSPKVSNMGKIVHGGATGVHVNSIFTQGTKLFELATQSIVNFQHAAWFFTRNWLKDRPTLVEKSRQAGILPCFFTLFLVLCYTPMTFWKAISSDKIFGKFRFGSDVSAKPISLVIIFRLTGCLPLAEA